MFEHGSTQDPRIHNGLTGSIRTRRIHHMCCIAQQCDIAVNPGRNRFTVDHGIFKYFRRATQHPRDVDPVVIPVFEMVQEIFMPYLFIPVAVGPAARIVDGDLWSLSDPYEWKLYQDAPERHGTTAFEARPGARNTAATCNRPLIPSIRNRLHCRSGPTRTHSRVCTPIVSSESEAKPNS
jgi:hypothetical protein